MSSVYLPASTCMVQYSHTNNKADTMDMTENQVRMPDLGHAQECEKSSEMSAEKERAMNYPLPKEVGVS